MGDMGELYKDTKELRKRESDKRKAINRVNGLKVLIENGLSYVEFSGGVHVVVEGKIDYWPITGKFIVRENNKSGRGIFNLIKTIKKEWKE